MATAPHPLAPTELFSAKAPPGLLAEMRALAQANGRSFSAEVREALYAWLGARWAEAEHEEGDA